MLSKCVEYIVNREELKTINQLICFRLLCHMKIFYACVFVVICLYIMLVYK